MREINCINCGAPIDPDTTKCPYCDTPYKIAYADDASGGAGYKPSTEQEERCKKCWYWRPLDGDYQYCCHYILEEEHSRGGDPCDKFMPGDYRRQKKGRGAEIQILSRTPRRRKPKIK